MKLNKSQKKSTHTVTEKRSCTDMSAKAYHMFSIACMAKKGNVRAKSSNTSRGQPPLLDSIRILFQEPEETEMPYIKKTCRAGKTKEYEFYYSYRFDQKGGSRKKKANRTPDAQKQVNRRMAEKKLTRLMNANFSGEDYYITLSYRKEERPDREELNRDIKRILRKMRKHYRQEGLELKYIWTAEKGTRGGAHIHIVVNGINNISQFIRGLWEKGWICIKPLDKSGQYRKLAGYFIKYSDRTMKTEKGFINKRYCSSKNLMIPEPEKRIIRGRNAYNHKIEVPAGWYVDKESIKEAWHEVTGYMYFSYTLVQFSDNKTDWTIETEESYILNLETGEVEIKERRTDRGKSAKKNNKNLAEASGRGHRNCMGS